MKVAWVKLTLFNHLDGAVEMMGFVFIVKIGHARAY
jgi:hypothetical protein